MLRRHPPPAAWSFGGLSRAPPSRSDPLTTTAPPPPSLPSHPQPITSTGPSRPSSALSPGCRSPATRCLANSGKPSPFCRPFTRSRSPLHVVGPQPPSFACGPVPRRLCLFSLSLLLTQLGTFVALASFQASNNVISGTVPPQLGALTKLTSLGLASNALSGQLPTQLGALVLLNQVRPPLPSPSVDSSARVRRFQCIDGVLKTTAR